MTTQTLPSYGKPVLAVFDYLQDPIVVYRDKNANNDYYVTAYLGDHLKAENLVSWTTVGTLTETIAGLVENYSEDLVRLALGEVTKHAYEIKLDSYDYLEYLDTF